MLSRPRTGPGVKSCTQESKAAGDTRGFGHALQFAGTLAPIPARSGESQSGESQSGGAHRKNAATRPSSSVPDEVCLPLLYST